MKGEHKFVYKMLKQGHFPVTRLISHEVTLEEAPTMIERMIRKDMHYCKVMLNIE
jgi:threonine dehydrogenase-like Zn-dependent dehydrogenase